RHAIYGRRGAQLAEHGEHLVRVETEGAEARLQCLDALRWIAVANAAHAAQHGNDSALRELPSARGARREEGAKVDGAARETPLHLDGEPRLSNTGIANDPDDL